MRKLIYICLMATLAMPRFVCAAETDMAVVVNKANSTSNLTKSQLRKLVLGEQGSWPGGAKVTVALRSPGNPERSSVLRIVCRMSEDDYNQHVLHSNLDGDTVTPPKVLASAVAIRQLVAATPGGIGFLRLADVNDSVKVVSVDGVAAGQPDYKIKVGQ